MKKLKIYIASHSLELARDLRSWLIERTGGTRFEFVCYWLNEVFNSTASYTAEERQRIATMDYEDSRACDVLILQAGPDKYSGAKFVEAGIAWGAGKKIMVSGRRENILLWHPDIIVFDSNDNDSLVNELVLLENALNE